VRAAGRMRRIVIITLLLAAVSAAAAAYAVTVQQPNGKRCGGILWRLKTFSDRDRNAVKRTPRQTTIGAIVRRPFPHPLPRRRATSFQRQEWEVVAQVTEYRLVGNELRLILYDHDTYMNAVLPAPSCLPRRTRARGAIASAWASFGGDCGRLTRAWQPNGAVLFIRGVGFWSSRFKMRRGAAPNGAELHPVTGFRAVAGCGT
jgi:hypothetical protein